MTALLFLSLYTILGVALALSSHPATGDANATDGITFRSSIINTTTADDSLLGTVKLFEYADFGGSSARVSIDAANTCNQVTCFDYKADSASWELPVDGVLNDRSYLGLFEHLSCQGKAHWFNLRGGRKNVTDLSDLNNKVTSVIVLKMGAGHLHYAINCEDVTGK